MRSIGAGRNSGEVPDAANVLNDAAETLPTIEEEVEIRNQRGALAAGGHVSGTKVAHDWDPGARCDHRGFAGLPGNRESASKKGLQFALVIQRLPVTADQIAVCVVLLENRRDGPSVKLPEQEVQARQVGNRDGARIHHRHMAWRTAAG